MSRDRYLRVLDDFTAVVDAVPTGCWDHPSPCPEWTARRLAGHLVDAQRQVVALVSAQGATAPVADPAALGELAGRDPAASWRTCREETVAALEATDSETTVPTPAGPASVAQVLTIAVVEPLVHAWDLATAVGREVRLDPEAVEATLPGVEALGGRLAATGMYRPAIAVDADAPAQDRLLAALGRSPAQSFGRLS
jgi:uncharacterized protein (TIGR03086 family)